MTVSREIKKALKQSFPGVKFSVRTRSYDYIYVTWQNGVPQGATVKAVEEVCSPWHTLKNISNDYDPIYSGTSIRLQHETTDTEYRNYVVNYILSKWDNERYYYDDVYNNFKDRQDIRNGAYHLNKELREYLANGVCSYLDDVDVIHDRDIYYENEGDNQTLLDERYELEANYLSQFELPKEHQEYVGKSVKNEKHSVKVLGAVLALDRGNLKIYNRQVYESWYNEPIKPCEEYEVYTKFLCLNQETNEEFDCNYAEIQDYFDPIIPEAITNVDFFITGKESTFNKLCTLAEYQERCAMPLTRKEHDGEFSNWDYERCRVEKIIYLSNAHYDRYVN